MSRVKLSLLTVYVTFFIDTLSWAIVFPIFAPYFLEMEHLQLSTETRMMLYGLLLMVYSLGQFLGAPLVGECADRYGRKRVLFATVCGTCLGLALTAWSIQQGVLSILFFSRLLTGVFASNTSLCLACVADMSADEKSKARNFGHLSAIAGMSFILGAFLGGRLSDTELNALFSPQFPIWLATALTAGNCLFVWNAFEETRTLSPSTAQFDFLESIHNLQKALQTEKIKRTYLIYFLFLFSWTLLLQFSPALVLQRFDFSNSEIGNVAVLMGLFWAAGSSYFNRLLLRHFSSFQVLELCLICFTILAILVAIPTTLWLNLAFLGGCMTLAGLAWPICLGILSDTASKEIQGKILGMSQSVQSLAMTVAPLVGGVVAQGMIATPFMMSAGGTLLAGLLYYLSLKGR